MCRRSSANEHGCRTQRFDRAESTTFKTMGQTGFGCWSGPQLKSVASLPLECTVSQSGVAAANIWTPPTMASYWDNSRRMNTCVVGCWMKCQNLSQRIHIQFTFYCEIHSIATGYSAGPWYMALSDIWKPAKSLSPSFLEALSQPNYTPPCWRRLRSAARKFHNIHQQDRGAREADSVADGEEEQADVGEEQEEHAEAVELLGNLITCLQPWWVIMSLMMAGGNSWFRYKELSWDLMMSFQCFRKHIQRMLKTAIIQRMFTTSRNVLLYCTVSWTVNWVMCQDIREPLRCILELFLF